MTCERVIFYVDIHGTTLSDKVGEVNSNFAVKILHLKVLMKFFQGQEFTANTIAMYCE